MTPIEKAKLCLTTILERKAIDPVLLHVENLSSITDYFLITGGNSTRQVQAITRHLQKTLKEREMPLYGIEGAQEGHWVLLDYGEVVIHIFYQPIREFYDLEGLWVEAPEVKLDL